MATITGTTPAQRTYLRAAVRSFTRAFTSRDGNTRADARHSAFLSIRADVAAGCSLTTAMFELERYTARHGAAA